MSMLPLERMGRLGLGFRTVGDELWLARFAEEDAVLDGGRGDGGGVRVLGGAGVGLRGEAAELDLAAAFDGDGVGVSGGEGGGAGARAGGGEGVGLVEGGGCGCAGGGVEGVGGGVRGRGDEADVHGGGGVGLGVPVVGQAAVGVALYTGAAGGGCAGSVHDVVVRSDLSERWARVVCLLARRGLSLFARTADGWLFGRGGAGGTVTVVDMGRGWIV